MTMMNRAQSALPHPDSSWSRKMSAKIVMSIQIQANRSMNQKIDRMMSQKFMADSGLEGQGRLLPCGSSAFPSPGPDLSPTRGDRVGLAPPADRTGSSRPVG